MHEPRAVAQAFLIESGADFHAARVLFRNGCHARAIYLAQQAVEKALKAALSLKGIAPKDHNLSPIFAPLFAGAVADIDRVLAAAQALERLGARARFPLYQRPDLPIWIPSREFGRKEAGQALTHCELVCRALKTYLVEQEGLEPFPEPA
ncbi:MAG: hypothetical protein Kow0092_26150 [Deferrisomatales bacterium]